MKSSERVISSHQLFGNELFLLLILRNTFQKAMIIYSAMRKTQVMLFAMVYQEVPKLMIDILILIMILVAHGVRVIFLLVLELKAEFMKLLLLAEVEFCHPLDIVGDLIRKHLMNMCRTTEFGLEMELLYPELRDFCQRLSKALLL